MKASEVRQKYLSFFESRGHVIRRSDSLVPKGDTTLLFTGSGMNQFKEMFMGRGKLEYTRAVSCQKCFRTADVEKVGTTSFHHTFFEMLGNFSFGDYFKKEATEWAWEMLLEDFKVPRERLVVSVYQDDEEAFDAWNKGIGLPTEIIYRYGESENFWPASAPSEGPNGPCGPCSEIFYDRGKDVGCGRPECGPECDCDRFVEIWNLVFTQYDRKDGGVLDPLPQKNIDTGMGLERMVAIMQGVESSFETDLFVPIIERIEGLIGNYEKNKQNVSRIRRIADHVRAVAFCIADGVLPSNEGRGYVERRLIRRAVMDANQLGFDAAFLYKVIPVVTHVMGESYPDLTERREHIARVIKTEEERFHRTLNQGLRILESDIESLQQEGETVLSGEQAFRLHDTYGFPMEVTESILAERGLHVDSEAFSSEMEQQRERARGATAISGEIFADDPLEDIKKRSEPTCFLGCETLETDAKVVAILTGEKLQEAEHVGKGERARIILDQTPFYGESGGQVGDTGRITSGGASMEVIDTHNRDGYVLHIVKVQDGEIKVGQAVRAEVDGQRRLNISRNHTATHMLQCALREHIGQHAAQSGSLVAPDRLRFDFTHFSALSKEELRVVENTVNERIMENATIHVEEKTPEEAKAAGAIALFGERYGDIVQVVSMGDFSKELCGGTHLDRTGRVGLFRITSEGSVAAGVRRIEAVTGTYALEIDNEREELIDRLCRILEAPEARLLERAEKLSDEAKTLRKELGQLKRQKTTGATDDIFARAETVSGVRVLVEKMPNAKMDDLRAVADAAKKSKVSTATVVAATAGEKIQLVAAFSPDLVKKGLHAGNVIKEIAEIVGGSGGGRADMAQAGGRDLSRLDEALTKAREKLTELVES